MARRKVLVVEKDQGQALVLRAMLEEKGYASPDPLTGRHSLKQALAFLKPDLLLLDIGLLETLAVEGDDQLIHESNIPLILLADNARDPRLRGVKEAGPHGFLVRPVKEGDLVVALEVTFARHACQVKLLASEARYRRIMDAVTDYTYAVEVRNSVAVRTVHSEACEVVTGYTPGELEADPCLWIAMVHEDDREAVAIQAEEILAGMAPDPLDHRIIRKDSALRWVRSTLVPHLGTDGRVESYDGLLQDITKHRQMDTALRESGEKHRTLFENMSQGVFYQDAGGEIFDANPAALDMFGLTREELLSRTSENEQWAVVREDGSFLPPDEHPSMAAMKTGDNVRDVVLGVFNPRLEGMVWMIVNAIPEFRTGEDSPYRVFVTMQNITHLIVARESLKEREDIYGAIVSQAMDGIVLIDAETLSFAEFNDAACERLGYTRQEFGNLTLHDIQGVITRDEVLERVRGILDAGRASFEARQRRKDGSLLDVLVSNRVIFRSGRRYLAGIWHDITELKQIEGSLRQSEAKYRFLTEKTRDIVWTVDAGFNTTYVSPSMTRAIGFSMEERMKQTPQETMTPESFERALRIFASEVERERKVGIDPDRALTMELEYYCKDGSTVWMENNVTAIRDDSGNIVGVHGVSRDITEKRKADELLRLSEQKFVSAFQSSPDPMAITDLETGMIVDANFSFLLFTGCSKEEVLGKSAVELGFWADPVDRERVVENIKAGVPVNNIELKVHSRDKGVRDMKFWARLLDIGGKRFLFTLAHDVTEEKIAAAKIRESEEHFRSLFTNMVEGVALHELVFDGSGKPADYRIIDVNPGFERILGMRREDVIGKSAGLVYGQPEAPYLEEYARVVSSCTPFGMEVFFQPMGKCFNISAIPWGRNGFATIFADITERKQAEEAIRNRQELLDSIIFVAPTGIGLSKDRIMIKVNDRLCEMTGYTQEELVGQPARMLYPNQEEFDFVGWEKYGQISKQGWGTVETRWQRKDGAIRDIILSSRPIRQDDLSAGVTFTALDITKRKKAEDELKKLASAIHQAAECIVITDPEGTIQYVNPAFEKVTGYAREEAIGSNPRILRSGEQDEYFYRELWGTITSGETWTGRFVNKRKDGTLYHEDAAVTPIRDDAGRIVNFVAVKRDITREINLEEQLLRAQKLEAIGTLAGGIAHDFNNILSIIIGYTELALDAIPTTDPAHGMAGEILKAGVRAKELVKQILTFSRKMDSRREPVRVQIIAKETVKLLNSTIPKNIAIKARIDADAGPVNADPAKIHQIIMNLCTNAYQAMIPAGGEMTVSLGAVTVDAKLKRQIPSLKKGPHVKLVVKDTGCGMGEEILKRIFDPFFTTKDKGKGTGLGLAMVYGIATELGGAITVSSAPGKGSSFSVYLPIAESRGEEIPGDDAEESGGQGRRGHILLVDDEEAIVNFARLQLEGLGYLVTAVSSSSEARTLFRADPAHFDLVITDYSMPEMNGVQLAKEICQTRPGTPVILMTGFSEGIDREIMRGAGIVSYVEKPFNRKAIADAITECLGR
jgi:two-component system, cell cycle sensor histidine kinase and response regulator CckA